MTYFYGESPANYEQKCLCVLVLDTSGSMQGEPIHKLNTGLLTFADEVQADFRASISLEISIITFSSKVECIQEPALIGNIEMPALLAGGTTRLVDAVRTAMQKVEARKQWYKDTGQPYYRPFIILITDGEPDRNQDMKGLSYEIKSSVEGKKFSFYALGVKGYNHAKLANICPTNTPPMPLSGYKFANFFKWLSNSISIINQSKEGEKIDLPPISGWAQIEI